MRTMCVWCAALFSISLLVILGCNRSEFSFPVQMKAGNEVMLRSDIAASETAFLAKRIESLWGEYYNILPFASKRNRCFTVTLIREKVLFLRYQKSIGPTKSDTGFYIPERAELVMYYENKDEVLRTLAHEAFHAYIEDRLIHPPSWLNEGLSEYAEIIQKDVWGDINVGIGIHKESKDILSRLLAENALPSLRDIITKDWPNPHVLTKEQYALSWSLVYFFESSGDQRKGEFLHYLKLIYDKQNAQTAFYSVWPKIEEIDAAWKKFIKNDIVETNSLTGILKRVIGK
jgi:hypothetical protein